MEATPALRVGDTVAVVSPAGPVPSKRLKPALRILERHFRVLVAGDLERVDPLEPYLAGDDEQRAEEMNKALRNAEVRCIWAARGGYGCSRIVSMLDDLAFKRDPVPIVGFSDITVLLAWAAQQGHRSIHGPVLTQFAELGDADQEAVLGMVQGRKQELLADGLVGQGEAALEGPLVGGNLSILAHLCGTALQPDFGGALCVLEDVGEEAYAVDRYLQQLLLQDPGSGLRGAAGVLLGDFTGRGEDAKENQEVVVAAAIRQVERARLPCFPGLHVGHGAQNRAFAYGGRARLKDGRLLALEPATLT